MHRQLRGRARTAAVAALAITALVAGCYGGEAGIRVTGAWARNSPAVMGAGAAYLVLQNIGQNADALIGASTPAAKTAEMHETKVIEPAVPSGSGGMGGMGSPAPSAAGGTGSPMMGMVPVSRIEIPGGASVELKPGGYHLMLMGLVADLKAGDTIDITLQFEKAGSITVKAEVRAQ